MLANLCCPLFKGGTQKQMKKEYTDTSGQPHQVIKTWRAALYVRLSREDEGEKEESYSVTSQREILKEYVKQHPDMEIFDIYVDDGFSGTNFDRPNFIRMMEDIKKGMVNCVLVKDLSRFCRNAVDGGYYLDDVFTRLRIRFIAINNCLDTFSPNMNASTRCITVGVQNVINESVAATTSVNVRSTLNLCRQKGQFIGSFACYGYLKDPMDHHRLIIDEEASEVVRKIFSMFINGKSIIGIAKELNAQNIPNPSFYKKLKGMRYNHPSKDKNDGLWSDSSVRRILKNETYAGNMVQGKNTTISYKIKKCRQVPREDWIIVKGTHEPIIDEETFKRVQSMFSNHVRTSPKTFEADLFAGLVKCSDCKKLMNKKTNVQPYGTYRYYKCPGNKKLKIPPCGNHTIRIDKLEQAVLQTLQKMIDTSLEISSLAEEINALPKNETRGKSLDAALESIKKEREKLLKMQLDLYPDWKDGIISKSEYLSLKERTICELKRLEEKENEAKKAREELEQCLTSSNLFLKAFTKYGRLESLNRAMILELIEEIMVFPDGKIEISFKFRDSYKEILGYIKENGIRFTA